MAATYLFILLCANYLPFFDNNAIALCRFPVFILGVLMAYYDWDVVVNKRNLLISFIYIVLVIWIIPTKELMNEHFENGYAPLFIFFITTVIPLLLLMTKMVEWSEHVTNRFLVFIGGLSLEIYIIHVMVLNILRDISVIQPGIETTPLKGCVLYVVVIALAVILAQCFSIITNRYIINSSKS